MMFFAQAWEYIKSHKFIWMPLAGAALFVAGLLYGRFLTPPTTITKTDVKVVTTEKVVVQTETKVQVVRVTDQDLTKKLHKVTTEVTKPDGSKQKTTTEDLNTDDVIHEKETEVKVVTVHDTVEKWQDRIVKQEVKTLKYVDWRVHAGVGLSVPYYLGQPEIGVPGMRGTVVDVGVDRRIAGPFWLGLQGNTQGTVGLSLGATW